MPGNMRLSREGFVGVCLILVFTGLCKCDDHQPNIETEQGVQSSADEGKNDEELMTEDNNIVQPDSESNKNENEPSIKANDKRDTSIDEQIDSTVDTTTQTDSYSSRNGNEPKTQSTNEGTSVNKQIDNTEDMVTRTDSSSSEIGNEPETLSSDRSTNVPNPSSSPLTESTTIESSTSAGEDNSAVDQKGKEIVEEAKELIASLFFNNKARGYESLKIAANLGNADAMELLAYGYLYGTVLTRNFTKSYEIFKELADNGHASGQKGLGLLYSTGIKVNSSQAKAVLYYTFAALGGHPQAQMSMGYRSFHGVGVPQSCEMALSYYSKVAETVASNASLFAGGHSVQKARLSDEGEESSTIFAGVTEDELEHYREVFADTGAQFSLGLYYLFGLGGVERNLPQALELLKRAETPASLALIGRIYAEGSPPHIPQSNDTAIDYFKQAIEMKSAEGFTGLGIMYFKGMGVDQDYRRALELFQKGSDKGSNEASLYIGLMNLFGLGIPKNAAKAMSSFKAAAQGGHILSYYYLAEIYSNGLSGRRNCKQAVELYKIVSERGEWSRMLREAHKTYLSGDVDSALMMYLQLAELGIEVAQSNAAYILHEGNSDLLVKNESLKRALMLWSRSATQGYGVARVMLGDYYYYGYGTETDMELAVDQYRLASDKLSNPQAMFNLGYMYENGIGLEQDFHLAKRYYDRAASTTADAAVPVYLALLKMNVMLYWHLFMKESSSQEGLRDTAVGIWRVLDEWDIYLVAVLCVLLAIAVRWHRRL